MKKRNYVLLLLLIVVAIAIFFSKNGNFLKRDMINNDSIFQDKSKDKNSVIDNIIEDTTIMIKSVEQASIDENANELNLRFFDEVTGYAVVPESVEIMIRDNGNTNKDISKGQISKNGTVLKHVSNGKYDIIVKAKGYLPINTFFDLNDQTVNINFNLAPINPPKEFSIANIQSLHQSDAMVIVGSIVDDIEGNPLENVNIYTLDGIAKTRSTDNGFFQLIIPLAENEHQVEERGTINFVLDKYITEVWKDFDMWPNGDYKFIIRMKKGSGINEIKVVQNRDVIRMIECENEQQ